MGRWEMLLGGDDRGPALRLPVTQAQARAAAGRYFSRSLVIENVFL